MNARPPLSSDQDLYNTLAHLLNTLRGQSTQDPHEKLEIAAEGIELLCQSIAHEIAAGERTQPDTVRVLRLLEYTGPRADVERDLSRRSVKVENPWPGTVRIRETFLSEFPEAIVGYQPGPIEPPESPKVLPHTEQRPWVMRLVSPLPEQCVMHLGAVPAGSLVIQGGKNGETWIFIHRHRREVSK